MKMAWIGLKDLLQTARDGKGLLMLLAMPLILITILGFAFGSQFNTNPGIQQFPLAVVDNDGGAIAAELKNILASEQLSELISPVSYSEAEARELVTDGKISVAIVIPAGFSEGFMTGKEVKLEVLKNRTALISPMIIESIAKNFADTMDASRLIAVRAISAGLIAHDGVQDLGRGVALDLQQLSPAIREEAVQGAVVLSAFQYYAAAMAIMFLLFAGMHGLQSITAEQRQRTYYRIAAAPVRQNLFVLGKFTGIVSIAFTQFVILMAGTILLFRVPWGNPWQALTVALVYSVAVSGLAMMAASLIRNEKTLLAVWPLSVQICSALGGSMVPLIIFPPAILTLSRFTPNYWGIKSLMLVMQNQPLSFLDIAPLIGIGVLSLCVAMVRMTREVA